MIQRILQLGKRALLTFTLTTAIVNWNTLHACDCFNNCSWLQIDSVVGLCVYITSYACYAHPGACQVTITWGDGTISSYTLPSVTFSDSHCYNACGTYNIQVVVQCGCGTCLPGTTVQSFSDILIQTSPSTEVCLGDTVVFTTVPNTPNYTYNWQLPPNNIYLDTSAVMTYITDSVGTFYIISWAWDSLYNCGDSDTVLLTVHPLPTFTLPDSIGTCYGDTALLGPPSFSAGSPPFSYNWTPPIDLSCTNCPNPIHAGINPGHYILEVTDVNGCRYQDTIEVIIWPLPIATAIGDSICLGDTATIQVTVSSGTPPFTYQWVPPPPASVFCDTCPTTQTDPTDTTTYTVIVTDQHGCQDTTTTTVIVYPLPVFDLLDTVLCWHDSAQITVPTGVAWQWTPNLYLSCTSCQTVIAWPPDTFTYTVTAYSIHGCEWTDQITIMVDSGAPVAALRDTIAYTGTEVNLLGITNVPIYWWYSPDGQFVNFSGIQATVLAPPPGESDTFYFWVQNENGCLTWDSVIVRGIEFPECDVNDWIPNTFTPNGDGVNDVLYIYATRRAIIEEWRIYTRWGELVFQAEDVRIGLPHMRSEIGWDGTYKGQRLRPDVYVYYYRISCGGNTYFRKGDVTLLY